jgi:AcrR family transcriptional regulator
MTSTQTQPSAPTRRQRRRLEIELRLLDASRRLFIEKGYDETTVAEIAETADVAYGTFFNYFPAKSDLLAAMGEREVAELSEQLSTLSRRSGRIDQALTLLFEGFAKRLEAASPRERALAAKIQSITFAAAPADRDLGYQEAFAAFIRHAVTSGRVRADVAVETLADLLASAYSAMALSWVHMPEFPVRDRARAIADLLGETLAPRETSSPR